MNASAEPAILEARDLCVAYGPLEVIRNVSFSLPAGQTVAVIGPNGAGKTTLFKALTGEVASRSGDVLFRGLNVTRDAAHERTRAGMGRTFQISRVFPEFSVRENVVVAVESRLRSEGIRPTPLLQWWPSRRSIDEAEHLLARLKIIDLKASPAAALSHGDKKRLELAMTLALKPSILMLDEPTAGMAPGDRREIVELIRKTCLDEGISVLMTEHDMDVIFELANHVMVLHYGQVIATGSVEEVRNNPTVREIYLGQEIYRAAQH